MSSYKALYRKYRPQVFSEVSDQDYVTRTLMNAIKLGRISHAYLLNGPRGIGKTSIARIFAKAINCENPNGAEPCDECEICKSITNGSNPDIIEIDAASRTRVENMRETLEKVNYLPSMSKYKVYIIDEVHMLSTSSFNALLKTLEEPPKHVVFILCTTEVEKVIPTIRSRCQRFDLHLIAREAMEERLKYVVNEENINIEDKAVSLIAEVSEGGMRDALSLLDQISAFSLNDKITADDVLEVSGKLSTDVLINIASSIMENDSSRAITLLDSLIKLGKEVEKITQSLISFYKDILVIKNTQRTISKIGYDKEEFGVLLKELSNTKIYKYIEILTEAMGDYRYSTNKRLYLELSLIKMCDKNVFVETIKSEQVTSSNNNVSTSKPYDPSKSYPTPDFTKKEEAVKEEIKDAPVQEETKEEPVIEELMKEDILDIDAIVDEHKGNNESSLVVDEKPQESAIILEEANEQNKPQEEAYDIHFFEEVLNKADRPFREKLMNEVEDARKKSKGTPFYKYGMLLDGCEIVASNGKSVVITCQEVGHCNLIMKEENIKGIHDLIKNELNYDLELIAIPMDLWKKISDEYIAKYRANYSNKVKSYIELTYVEYPGLRISKNSVKPVEEDKYKNLEDLFGDILSTKD